jgi:hypothetical protein
VYTLNGRECSRNAACGPNKVRYGWVSLEIPGYSLRIQGKFIQILWRVSAKDTLRPSLINSQEISSKMMVSIDHHGKE